MPSQCQANAKPMPSPCQAKRNDFRHQPPQPSRLEQWITTTTTTILIMYAPTLLVNFRLEQVLIKLSRYRLISIYEPHSTHSFNADIKSLATTLSRAFLNALYYGMGTTKTPKAQTEGHRSYRGSPPHS